MLDEQPQPTNKQKINWIKKKRGKGKIKEKCFCHHAMG
jgi:hypothetical protein